MYIENMTFPKNGEINIQSIFQMKDGYIEIQALLRDAAKENCTVYFENEDWRVAPGDVDSIATRAAINAYSSIITYPKAARDYCNYIFSITDKKS